ncbi:conserved membrane hypothetical protein [Candidatus Roizmanbacteria bacterium]|nr:conserved membrane hypothetical protein [Candidatus Roizmanbacteria bacterium]
MRKLSFFIFFLLILLFCYFRLKPIFFQTVPYTYDQGRDFLKAQQIVRDLNPTLIGPTSGIPGLFHGVWWYYFLAIPYIIFSGLPIGFSIFIFINSLLQLIFFSYFLKKEFGWLTALIFALFVTGSSYFITMSFFVISSVFTFPFILLFLYSAYLFLKTENKKYFFWLFLWIGFILEAELPSGLFTGIAFILTLLFLGKIKLLFSKDGFKKACLGFIIPLVPRLLFEVIKGFPQSKTVLKFFLNLEFHSPKPFIEIFRDRLSLFNNYLVSSFPFDNSFVVYGIFILSIVGIFIAYIKSNKKIKNFFIFPPLMIVLFFLLSILYKDNFWSNYYEGIGYYFILTIAFGFYGFSKLENKLIKNLPWLIFVILLLFNLSKFSKEIKNNVVVNDGLRKQLITVDRIYEINKGKNDFCVRIYTPPVIPYTYNYLFDYYHNFKNKVRPMVNYVDNQCWYIIEDDSFKFRIDKFRKEHIPAAGKLIKTESIHKDVVLELWQDYPQK